MFGNFDKLQFVLTLRDALPELAEVFRRQHAAVLKFQEVENDADVKRAGALKPILPELVEMENAESKLFSALEKRGIPRDVFLANIVKYSRE